MRALVVICFAAACGYPPLDANPDGNMPHGDGSGSGSSACQVPSTYGHPTISQQMAFDFPQSGQNPEQIQYLGQLNNDTAPDFLEIDLYDSYPPFQSGLGAPVQIALTDDSFNCGGCVFIQANCPNCFATNAVPGSWYTATSGTLSLTALGSNMTGTITNAMLAHSTDPNAGPVTLMTDGCTTVIESMSFSAAIQQQ